MIVVMVLDMDLDLYDIHLSVLYRDLLLLLEAHVLAVDIRYLHSS
jgi:hypothetical protein